MPYVSTHTLYARSYVRNKREKNTEKCLSAKHAHCQKKNEVTSYLMVIGKRAQT